MENFKLDLSKLTPVAESDRVKGNWYVVADYIGNVNTFSIRRYHSGNKDMNQGGSDCAYYIHWFAIPPNLPGFPVQELPDIIKLPLSEWSYSYSDTHILLHRKPRTVGTLVLPAGTIEERKKRLQEELDKLGSL